MLVTRNRTKLLNAVIFFSTRTKWCGKTKLFKLLYFLDFQHYQSTGRSVTGLEYYAWKMGPVPTELYDEINNPEPDMAEALIFSEKQTVNGHPMLTITPHKTFDAEDFTKREMRLLESLATEYEHSSADDMVEATHLENSPWDKVYVKENKRQELIPYSYALKSSELEEMSAMVAEREELVAKLK